MVSLNSSAGNTDLEPKVLWAKRLAFEAEAEAVWKKLKHPDVYWEGALWRTVRLGLQGVGLYRRGMVNADQPVLTQRTISCATLPSGFDGFRILLLSDLHFNDRFDHGEALEKVLKGVKPDLVALGGDYEYRMFAPEAWVLRGIKRLQTYLKPSFGYVAVLGNNDRSVMVPLLEGCGIQVLINTALRLERGGDVLWMAGIDDPHDFLCDSVACALRDVPADAFSILLAHSPEVIATAAAHGIDVYLCGHTHGGQICLPKFGPLFTNARSPRRYARGVWRYGAMQGYTSSGLGTSALPVRFACPPEAVLITLRKE